MEIIGRSIAHLQNQFVSGLEAVTAGVVESTKASGAEALRIAQDSFSFEQLDTIPPAVQNLASSVFLAAYEHEAFSASFARLS